MRSLPFSKPNLWKPLKSLRDHRTKEKKCVFFFMSRWAQVTPAGGKAVGLSCMLQRHLIVEHEIEAHTKGYQISGTNVQHITRFRARIICARDLGVNFKPAMVCLVHHRSRSQIASELSAIANDRSLIAELVQKDLFFFCCPIAIRPRLQIMAFPITVRSPLAAPFKHSNRSRDQRIGDHDRDRNFDRTIWCT